MAADRSRAQRSSNWSNVQAGLAARERAALQAERADRRRGQQAMQRAAEHAAREHGDEEGDLTASLEHAEPHDLDEEDLEDATPSRSSQPVPGTLWSGQRCSAASSIAAAHGTAAKLVASVNPCTKNGSDAGSVPASAMYNALGTASATTTSRRRPTRPSSIASHMPTAIAAK